MSFRRLSLRVADNIQLRWIRLCGILAPAFRILRILTRCLCCLAVAPIVLPIAYLLRRWSPKDERDEMLPTGIPTRREMKALERHMAESDPAAIRIWLRGAFYYQAVQVHGEPKESAAAFAHNLAEQTNTADGFTVRIQVGT